MIHLVNGKVIPDNQIDCLNINSFTKSPESPSGNCKRCAMKQFTRRKIDSSKYYGYTTREIVDIESCPWFLMMQERDRAISKNDSLKETISDTVNEISILKEILEKNKSLY